MDGSDKMASEARFFLREFAEAKRSVCQAWFRCFLVKCCPEFRRRRNLLLKKLYGSIRTVSDNFFNASACFLSNATPKTSFKQCVYLCRSLRYLSTRKNNCRVVGLIWVATAGCVLYRYSHIRTRKPPCVLWSGFSPDSRYHIRSLSSKKHLI